ncbi:MAG: hypothetical protein AAB767_01735, partial [Patescibacteria group bacterium]
MAIFLFAVFAALPPTATAQTFPNPFMMLHFDNSFIDSAVNTSVYSGNDPTVAFIDKEKPKIGSGSVYFGGSYAEKPYYVGKAGGSFGERYPIFDTGTDDFVALGQTSRWWHGMAAAPNGDVYASVYDDGDIYLQTNGTGDFVALGQTSRHWVAMAAAPNGNVYAADSGGLDFDGGDIYMQTN